MVLWIGTPDDTEDVMSNLYQLALDELRIIVGRMDDEAVDRACEMISTARRVVVFGCGREGLQIRGFAMRLFHLGRNVAVVGDMTAPAVGPGDLFVATIGPGELSTALALLQVARTAGATILVLTAQPAGPAGTFADFILTIPAQTMADDQGPNASSIRPMGSLYEGALFIVFEVMVAKLRAKLKTSPEVMRANHTNLE
jgi:6-phospho-3-hexuloisomerase